MMHLPPLISDLALILAAGAIFSIIFKFLKQPVVLGYLMAGFVVGPHFPIFFSVIDQKNINIWAEIGVIFLLFGLGLEFSFRKLLKVGGSASITALVEIIFMLVGGYFLGKTFGWSKMDSLFLGGILCISSTTIIIRAFEESGVKAQKFAQLVFGVLIVEDLVAILLLVLLSTFAVSLKFQGSELIQSIVKLLFFLTVWFSFGMFALPTVLRSLRKYFIDELYVVFAVGLCFIMVVFATSVGFSPALGAFVMGSLLGETQDSEKFEHYFQPIKHLFAVIFFVSVGMLINPTIIYEYLGPILIITLVTVFGKFISSTLGALISGQSLKTSIFTGLSLAQIGEFSFIIATLGLSLKVTNSFLYPIAVAVSALTTFLTPYLISSAGPIYEWIESKLPKKWKNSIVNYGTATQRIGYESVWKNFLFKQFMSIFINSVLVISITLVGVNILLPFSLKTIEHRSFAKITSYLVCFILSLPFIWAIAFHFYKKHLPPALTQVRMYYFPIFILRSIRVLVAMALVAFQISQFFPFTTTVIVSLLFIFLFISRLSTSLEKTYIWVRDQFVRNLNEKHKKNKLKEHKVPLAPWDAHIAQFTVSQESPFVAKPLESLKLKELFGVTIVMIQRGRLKIHVPARDHFLLPFDTIFVLGTDEQLMKFKSQIEVLTEIETAEVQEDYKLQSFLLEEDSPFLGKTIRSSGFREAIEGLIVGIEREGKRILNPDSSFELMKGDLLWIVADQKKLMTFTDRRAASKFRTSPA